MPPVVPGLGNRIAPSIHCPLNSFGLNEPAIVLFVQSVHNTQCDSETNHNEHVALRRQWYTCLSKSKPDLSDVLPAWRYTPNAFIEAMYCLGWKSGHSIERVIEENPLEPGNIQFVPYNHKIRTRRRGNTRYVTAFGVVAPIAWFIDNHTLCKVKDYHVIYGRIASGWSVEKAMTTPSSGRPKPEHCTYSQSTVVEFNGVSEKLSNVAKSSGIKTKDLVKRLNLGWSLDQAINTPLYGVRPSRKPGANRET